MTPRKVLCIHPDARKRGAIAECVRALGEDPLEAQLPLPTRLSRAAAAVVAGGDDGLELLARLARKIPNLPRIAVFDIDPDHETLIGVIERIHPFAVVVEPIELRRLSAVIRDALAISTEGVPASDNTNRMVRPQLKPDFDQLVHDRLTGAESYHYLRLRLDEEIERASRYGRALSLALIDLDDLRGINDRYGTDAGDLALTQVAQTLLAGARAVDHVGRWAGGAFALLLPETAAGAAYGLAERLRADIAAHRPGLPVAGSHFRLTVSCGVAEARSASLVERADAALWRAKQGGRNRSVLNG